ncbi:MAG TPA: ABC transporter permease [Bacteroidales bacterium]|jgi:putative ABC transport system permease protein|nr:ABC transporter permease [Bacteroidales bacterium]OPZ57920.1 MAG: Macrolide export ATP-binding/permease protein MacB [Bacteroidetes bacterium ADurb.BinA012]MBK7733179.1 ABC transporter permease [Bacteroidales bacterium]MBP7036768.1 ABC transporter permease [Bacteroidales bacterium]MBP8709824.1 ABC transporter permease [Bacteroidales bacterium]
MFKRYGHDIRIALESILSNKLKSALTALGIIFGVAAVISMLAIGKGAQQEILDQIKMVGVNNILISPIVQEKDAAEEDGEKQLNKFSRGLTLLDVEAIRSTIPAVKRISPEISFNSTIVLSGMRHTAKLVGVSNDYFELYNLPLSQGAFFNDYQEEYGIQVCIIGANIRAKFFSQVDPIGQYLKFDNVWLKVMGVLEKTNVSLTGFEEQGVNVYNDNVYIPIKTMLMRYQNRALVNTKLASEASVHVFGGGRGGRGRVVVSSTNASTANAETNYNQLDKIVVQVAETEQLTPTTEVLSRMMLRRHSGVKDFEITVPELLLKQQQRTKDIFNIVLGAIASISLIVGGIGIMNIMFASVMERIKEIGTRMAIGAKKMDIVVQFLSEAVLISVSGGFIGIFLGIILAVLIQKIAGITTIVSFFSVVVAFGVSAAVGVIFGYSPAKRASERDPIESLRYE